ncbi:MAG: hypothetical protein COV67_08835 [Nitrospinae bacterium CG11_big_fil_rev_8_21_14_0_20_56_8]|nr:MAG: hypothetical protein COV67_08835 [Nitrospinae bacterium CG11_big_fil_rev_8_21_14_0_20_56_8]
MKTIAIKTNLECRLEEESKISGQDPETLVHEILDRGLTIRKLKRLRGKMVPKARIAGLSDEDEILRSIS